MGESEAGARNPWRQESLVRLQASLCGNCEELCARFAYVSHGDCIVLHEWEQRPAET